MSIKVKINGKDYTVDVEEDMPLLWVVRDVLKMTGTKFGCGQGLCGACTMHLDGGAIRSCITPVQLAVGRQVTTIEGLSKDGDHAIQKAWLKHSVPQCGYCQPGQMMNAAALIKDNKQPSDEDIDAGMSGNLCRCGTYQRIKQAIKDAASGNV